MIAPQGVTRAFPVQDRPDARVAFTKPLEAARKARVGVLQGGGAGREIKHHREVEPPRLSVLLPSVEHGHELGAPDAGFLRERAEGRPEAVGVQRGNASTPGVTHEQLRLQPK